jgi:hypothetical protein
VPYFLPHRIKAPSGFRKKPSLGELRFPAGSKNHNTSPLTLFSLNLLFMSVCIVYHSETGNTKRVAEAAAKVTGATLIPVRDLAGYNKITMYLRGIPRARAGDKAAIEPPVIDVSPFDVVVVGSPVWAFRPTPAANAAIAALSGCEGKKGIVFITSGGGPRDALEIMKRDLEKRKVKVEGSFHFPMKELGSEEKLKEFTEAIRKVSGKG